MNQREGIVFLGTPDLAALCLEGLFEAQLPIIGVITQPDSPVGRKRIITPSPVKILAQEKGVPVFTPEDWKEEGETLLRSLNPKVAVVVAYGRIIPPGSLVLPESFINLHFSLLPEYRGAAPVQRAIYEGKKETGLSIQYLAEKLDAGPIIAQEKISIEDDDTTASLWERCAKKGALLLQKVCKDLLQGRLPSTPQAEEKATYAAKMRREDGFLDWTRGAKELHDKIRACNPWPGAVTKRNGKELKIWKSALVKNAPGEVGQPGELLCVKNGLFVSTGEGFLELKELQTAGGARMSAAAYAAGLRQEQACFEGMMEEKEK